MRKFIGFFFVCVFMASLGAFACAQVAPGVQQAAGQAATITGTVELSDGTFVAGADVKLIGPAVLSTTSDTHGVFQFTAVPHGTYTIIANAGGLGVTSRANLAVSNDINIQIQYARTSNTLRTIANVTTRAIGAHINVTAASVASVNPRDFAFSGNTSWKQMLEQIPGVTVNGAANGGEQHSGTIGNPLNGQVISINGALPYETSTTMDGMPFFNVTFGSGFSTGGSADLSVVPMAGFDAADIVRGPGANAPSIVDSIGGSLVLHAPGPIDKTHVELSLSNDPFGGVAENSLAQFKIGRKLSVLLGYNFYDSPGVFGKNAQIATAAIITPATINGQSFYGCAAPGYFSHTSCTTLYNPSLSSLYNYAGGNPNAAICGARYYGCVTYTSSLVLCCVPRSSAWTQHGYSAALNYKISNAFTAQYFYAGSSYQDDGGSALSYLYNAGFEPFSSGYAGAYPTGQHLYNEAGYVSYPITESSWLGEERLTGFIGKGVLRVSALQDYSYSGYTSNGYMPDGTYTLYGTGYYCGITCAQKGAPVVFNGTSAALTFTQFTFNEPYWGESRAFLTSYGTQVGSRSNIGAAFTQSYVDSPWNVASEHYGSTDYCTIYLGLCTWGLDPSVAQTTREVRINEHTDFSDKFGVDLSYYWARGTYHVYSCTGSLAGSFYFSPCHNYTDFAFPYRAPRMGLTWRPNQDVVFRAAVGGGFALPQISYLSPPSGAPTCVSGYCYLTLQNLGLQPEKAFSWDVGSDVRFKRNTSISVDLYRTNLYGQFYKRYAFSGTYNGMPLYTYQTLNLVPTRYEGVNLSINHDPGVRGIFYSVGGGLMRSFITSLPANFYTASPFAAPCTSTNLGNCAGLTQVPAINLTSGGLQGGYYVSGSMPYSNGSATLGYRWNPQTYLSITPTYYGPNNAYYEPAFVEFNADGSYSLAQNTSIHMTFRNIFNTFGGNQICWNCLGGVQIAAPTAFGPPSYQVPDPWGPRTAIVTLEFKQ